MLTFLRLRFGVDFGDEAYYLAIPYRFFLGDRPFVDEVFLSQSFGLLTFPLVSLFCKIRGGTEGIVYFARQVFLLFNLGVALFIYFCLRGDLGRRNALLMGAVFFAFIPLSLPGLGYNTLGLGFLTMALLLCYYAVRKERHAVYFGGVGALIGLTTIAHPALIVPGLSVLATLYFLAPRTAGFRSGFLVGGIALVGCFFLFAYRIRPSDLWASFLNMRAFSAAVAGPIRESKVIGLVRGVLPSAPFLGSGIVWMALLFWSVRRSHAAWLIVSVVMLPVVTFFAIRARWGGLGLHGYPLLIGLLAPFFFLLTKNRHFQKKILLSVWVPSTVAAITWGLVSNSGATQSGLGMFPGFLVSLALLLGMMRSSWGGLGLLVSTLAIFLYFQYAIVWREGSYRRLTTQVNQGPFKGLRTTEFKKDFVERLGVDIQSRADGTKRIAFHCFFPAGYLLSNMKPATASVWGCRPQSAEFCQKPENRFSPDYVLAVEIEKGIAEKLGTWEDACSFPDSRTANRFKAPLPREGYALYLTER